MKSFPRTSCCQFELGPPACCQTDEGLDCSPLTPQAAIQPAQFIADFKAEPHLWIVEVQMGQRPVGTRRGVEQTPSIVSPKDATKARLVDVERRFQSTAKGGTPMHHDGSNLLNPSTEPPIDALRAGARL